MNLASFPYKWTFLIGVIFVGSLLWSNIFLDGPGFLLVALSAFCLLSSLIASIVLFVSRRSKIAFYRVLINVTICLLFFPTVRLGGYLGTRLFVKHLGRFQAATNLLIEAEIPKFKPGVSLIQTQLPPGFSDLHVADRVLIDSKQSNITIRYTSRDSSALGHRGYLYRSDDDPVALAREFPTLGCTRVASHWFSFSD
jgi:hypothetical protein